LLVEQIQAIISLQLLTAYILSTSLLIRSCDKFWYLMHFYCYLYILVLKQNMVGNIVIT